MYLHDDSCRHEKLLGNFKNSNCLQPFCNKSTFLRLVVPCFVALGSAAVFTKHLGVVRCGAVVFAEVIRKDLLVKSHMVNVKLLLDRSWIWMLRSWEDYFHMFFPSSVLGCCGHAAKLCQISHARTLIERKWQM